MDKLVQAVLNSDEKTALRQLIGDLRASGKCYFLQNEIWHTFEDYCHKAQKPAYFYHSTYLGQLIHYTHEILLEEESICFLLRPRMASQKIYRVAADLSSVEPITSEALLALRDRLVNRYQSQILEIDVGPFYKGSPTIDDPRNIGRGLEFLNRYLCSQQFTNPQDWLEGIYDNLYHRQYDGIPLLINERIETSKQLVPQLKKAIQLVSQRPRDQLYEKFRFDLQGLGFEPGWGDTATRVGETLELLKRLIEQPQPAVIEALVSRIPRIFRVVLVSVHGWVAQEGVLGRPETGGQVTYVFEQARSLEQRLRHEIQMAGLDVLGIEPQVIILTRLIPNCEGTRCNLQREKIRGTENGWILRVPFPEENPQVTQNWMSKFEVWPYLEGFALTAERELLAQLGGDPDLIIGNNSDGNLVAFLLARRLKTVQCNIAHSLAKPKYLFGNLYWQDLEEKYHFSVQLTADLISMNAADFIINSSHQEIIGTVDSAGQYESYKCFTMPGLYHVVNGIELFSPKFNVIPPGVNENIFFPYYQEQDRVEGDRLRLNQLLFSDEDRQILGNLDDLNKRPIFSFSLSSALKNLSTLAECFGQSPALQERCNLILLTGKLHPEEAHQSEERQDIEKLHHLINQYHLQGKVRWLGMRLSSPDLGEAYRAIADRQGIFVHCALFEAFGLTLLEAMISGLPTFATQFGGPSEIIQPGKNGFLINPTDLAETAAKILHFLDQCEGESQYWQEISHGAIQRVRDRYNWQVHTKRLLVIAKIYSFWKQREVNGNRDALQRYLEALYYLIYKPRAATIIEQHRHRSNR